MAMLRTAARPAVRRPAQWHVLVVAAVAAVAAAAVVAAATDSLNVQFRVLWPPEVAYLYNAKLASDFGGRFHSQCVAGRRRVLRLGGGGRLGSASGAGAGGPLRPRCRGATSCRHASIPLVLVQPEPGCVAADNAAELVGAVALVRRGQCDFVVKAGHAQAAGAVAVRSAPGRRRPTRRVARTDVPTRGRQVIVADNQPPDKSRYVLMVDASADGSGGDIVIPVLFITTADGDNLRQAISARTAPAQLLIPLNYTSDPASAEFPLHKRPPWSFW